MRALPPVRALAQGRGRPREGRLQQRGRRLQASRASRGVVEVATMDHVAADAGACRSPSTRRQGPFDPQLLACVHRCRARRQQVRARPVQSGSPIAPLSGRRATSPRPRRHRYEQRVNEEEPERFHQHLREGTTVVGLTVLRPQWHDVRKRQRAIHPGAAGRYRRGVTSRSRRQQRSRSAVACTAGKCLSVSRWRSGWLDDEKSNRHTTVA